MDQEVYFENIHEVIINQLRQCEHDLKIAVAWITDKEIISEIDKLISKGIVVSIIIFDDKINNKELFKELYYSRASIYLSKKMMHNKFCIIDNKTIINGSYNWTRNAKSNSENIHIISNNYDLASKFSQEFQKIIKSCSTIDGFFEYSIQNLESIEDDFHRFLTKRKVYKFPYFINATGFNPSKINSKSDIRDYIYLIRNNDEEYRLLWYCFLLESQYSLERILNLKKNKIILPLKYRVVNNLKFENNVAEFNNLKYLVEEKTNKREINYLYFIDKKGDVISNKILFNHKLKNDLYLMKYKRDGKLPYFVNKELNFFEIEYEILELIEDEAIVVRKFVDFKFLYGLLNTNNELLIPLIYDDFIYEEGNAYIDFVEFPILLVNHNVNINKVHQINSFDIDFNKITKDAKTDLNLHRYRFTQLTNIQKYNFSGILFVKSRIIKEDLVYLFYSDSNFKFKYIYEKVCKLPKIEGIHTNKIDSSLTIRELNDLKQFAGLVSEQSFVDRKFQNLIEHKINLGLKAQNSLKKDNEFCYIATMVYEDYNHPDVIVLRKFRDNFLKKYYFGRKAIKFYYLYSPYFVNFVSNKLFLRKITKAVIIKIVKFLKQNHFKTN